MAVPAKPGENPDDRSGGARLGIPRSAGLNQSFKVGGQETPIQRYRSADRLRFRIWASCGQERRARIACYSDPPRPEIKAEPMPVLLRPLGLPQHEFAGIQIEHLLEAGVFFDLGQQLVRDLNRRRGLRLFLDPEQRHQIDFCFDGIEPPMLRIFLKAEVHPLLKEAAQGICPHFTANFMD